jgi:hypothetical protein
MHRTYNSNIAELVCNRNCVEIQHCRASDPSGVGVVSKDNELIFHSLVSHTVDTFLNIAHVNAVSNSLNVYDHIGYVLKDFRLLIILYLIGLVKCIPCFRTF